MLILSGYGAIGRGIRTKALKSIASIVQKAKADVGISVGHKIPAYKSPLLMAKEKRESSIYTPTTTCKSGQVMRRGQCTWPETLTPTTSKPNYADELKVKKDLAVAQRRVKQIEESTKTAYIIARQGTNVSSTAVKTSSKIKKFAGLLGFSGFGQDEGEITSPDYQEQETQQEEYQEEQPFDIETAKQNIMAMQKDITTIENAVAEGKKAIIVGKKQIADGRRQIASI